VTNFDETWELEVAKLGFEIRCDRFCGNLGLFSRLVVARACTEKVRLRVHWGRVALRSLLRFALTDRRRI